MAAHVTKFKGADDLASRFDGLAAKDVPAPNEYNFAIKWSPCGPDSDSVTGAIYVQQPEYFIVLNVRRPEACGIGIDRFAQPGFVMQGTLDPAPAMASKLMWISLDAVNEKHHLDVKVDASGKFRIHEELDGLYILCVREDGVVLHTQPVMFHPKSGAQFVIHLPQDHLPLLRVGSQ
ncbi:MAG TPA: hypothetical protein VKS01_08635 [Bryobacteraceae bacterium]|nr:hypothetical protein [Bryobacteraceae bacterium]